MLAAINVKFEITYEVQLFTLIINQCTYIATMYVLYVFEMGVKIKNYHHGSWIIFKLKTIMFSWKFLNIKFCERIYLY